jgi:hypothetical protein
MEYDGGLPRDEAEWQAYLLVSEMMTKERGPHDKIRFAL